MISIPGSLSQIYCWLDPLLYDPVLLFCRGGPCKHSYWSSVSFAKLVMMSSAPAKSAGDSRYASQDPFIHGNQHYSIQSRLQSVIGVSSFYVERNKCNIIITKISLKPWLNWETYVAEAKFMSGKQKCFWPEAKTFSCFRAAKFVSATLFRAR